MHNFNTVHVNNQPDELRIVDAQTGTVLLRLALPEGALRRTGEWLLTAQQDDTIHWATDTGAADFTRTARRLRVTLTTPAAQATAYVSAGHLPLTCTRLLNANTPRPYYHPEGLVVIGKRTYTPDQLDQLSAAVSHAPLRDRHPCGTELAPPYPPVHVAYGDRDLLARQLRDIARIATWYGTLHA